MAANPLPPTVAGLPSRTEAMDLVEAFTRALIQQIRDDLEYLFPEVDGQRVFLFHEVLTEEEEWFLLEETYRKYLLWREGMADPDEDVSRFAANEDDAQGRLLELREKFSIQGYGR